MKLRVIAVSILVILSISFPLNKTVDVEVKVSPRHHPIQTKATPQQKKANKVMARKFAIAGYGWDLRQQKCIHNLFMKESKFDHLAKNQKGSSAYGIAQVLKEKSSDPAIQILHAYKYIEHRYGTPCSAWSHHLRRNWY
jgi:hypothetical protein